MKTLIVVRHAKSSWANLGQPDFERPLNDRGLRDAPIMAERLKSKTSVDLFVSSPAKRALKTCKIFCDVFDYNKKEILEIEELYHASTSTFYDVISRLDDDSNNIALFSHNPGITDFANSVSDKFRIDNLPTCAIVAIQMDGNSWKEFETANKKVVYIDYPKMERGS